MCQFLSWALARSPGIVAGRERGSHVLGCGLVPSPVGSKGVVTGTVVALAGQHDQPGRGQLAEMPQIRAASRW
jgi:hypothetical protein